MLILARTPKVNNVSDFLNWHVMPAEDTIITKNAEIGCVFRYTPRDLASSSPEQLMWARAASNRAVRHFGSSWALWFEACRYQTDETDHSEWPDPVSQMIDGERQKLFTGGMQHKTDHFITLLYAPKDTLAGLSATFDHKDKSARGQAASVKREIERFKQKRDEFAQMLRAGTPDVRLLSGSELLSYLKSTISTDRPTMYVEPFPLYLAEYLAEGAPILGGRKMMIGSHHMRTIRIFGLPPTTTPEMFAELDAVPFPYRRVARWIPLDDDDARKILDDRKVVAEDSRIPFLTQLMAQFTKTKVTETVSDDPTAALVRGPADDALIALGKHEVTMGYWSHTITVTDTHLDALEDKVRIIQSVLGCDGFRTSVCDGDDAHITWIGSLPMHPHGDLGRLLGASDTFCDVLPNKAIWQGNDWDHHLNGPPLLRGISPCGTPFKMALHPPGSDVGHTLIIGQTGAGKSTLIGSMIAGYRKYQNSRVIVIDRGASAKVITLALDGSFHALAAEDSAVSLQPLAHTDEPEERAWAFDYLLGIMAQEGIAATPQQKALLTSAIDTIGTRPHEQRTLTVLRALLQDEELKLAISPFCLGGSCGDLLDNDRVSLGSGSAVECFETAALMERKTAIGPVLAAVFHEIERSFDGTPTLLIIDEAWAALDHPLLSEKLRSWLKTARKKNVQVVLASQSLADIARNPALTEAVSESCLNRIYTANDRATEPRSAETLSAFGLTNEQIRIIAGMQPKSEYVVSRDGMWRKFSLCLSATELAFVGSSRPEDIAAADRIFGTGCDNARRWLEHCGAVNPAFAMAAE